jgi:serine/threonine-protein kinase RsbW
MAHNRFRFKKSVIKTAVGATRFKARFKRFLPCLGFTEEDVFGILLALEEALVNAIKHGNQNDKQKKVTIRWRVTKDEVLFVITDEGKGFNPEDVPNPLEVENLERPCGRGLLLMRHYMTEVEYIPPGNKVRLRKFKHAPAPVSS